MALHHLQYHPELDHPPSTLGIPWTEGPLPDRKTIQDRWNNFKYLHEHALKATTETAPDKPRIQHIYEKKCACTQHPSTQLREPSTAQGGKRPHHATQKGSGKPISRSTPPTIPGPPTSTTHLGHTTDTLRRL